MPALTIEQAGTNVSDLKGKRREVDNEMPADSRWQQTFPIPEQARENDVCTIDDTDDIWLKLASSSSKSSDKAVQLPHSRIMRTANHPIRQHQSRRYLECNQSNEV